MSEREREREREREMDRTDVMRITLQRRIIWINMRKTKGGNPYGMALKGNRRSIKTDIIVFLDFNKI